MAAPSGVPYLSRPQRERRPSAPALLFPPSPTAAKDAAASHSTDHSATPMATHASYSVAEASAAGPRRSHLSHIAPPQSLPAMGAMAATAPSGAPVHHQLHPHAPPSHHNQLHQHMNDDASPYHPSFQDPVLSGGETSARTARLARLLASMPWPSGHQHPPPPPPPLSKPHSVPVMATNPSATMSQPQRQNRRRRSLSFLFSMQSGETAPLQTPQSAMSASSDLRAGAPAASDAANAAALAASVHGTTTTKSHPTSAAHIEASSTTSSITNLHATSTATMNAASGTGTVASSGPSNPLHAATPAGSSSLLLPLFELRKQSAGSAFSQTSSEAQKNIQDALDAHIVYALRRSALSKTTLAFTNSVEEHSYTQFFFDQNMQSWRSCAVFGIFFMLAFELIISLCISIPADLSIPNGDAILSIVGLLPMCIITALSFTLPHQILTKHIHFLSLAYLIFAGPVLVCGRYFITKITMYDAVDGAFYITVLFLGVFFFKIRFIYTVVALAVANSIWFGVTVAAVNSHQGTQPSFLGLGIQVYLIWSTVSLCIASCGILAMAYVNERNRRLRYLSDVRFMAINAKLTRQLRGLRSSYESRIADLDSPLEKAILAVKALLCTHVSTDQIRILHLILSCLTSSNLLTPDLYQQVQSGDVQVDDEQEKWLFNEIAARKTFGAGILIDPSLSSVSHLRRVGSPLSISSSSSSSSQLHLRQHTADHDGTRGVAVNNMHRRRERLHKHLYNTTTHSQVSDGIRPVPINDDETDFDTMDLGLMDTAVVSMNAVGTSMADSDAMGVIHMSVPTITISDETHLAVANNVLKVSSDMCDDGHDDDDDGNGLVGVKNDSVVIIGPDGNRNDGRAATQSVVTRDRDPYSRVAVVNRQSPSLLLFASAGANTVVSLSNQRQRGRNIGVHGRVGDASGVQPARIVEVGTDSDEARTGAGADKTVSNSNDRSSLYTIDINPIMTDEIRGFLDQVNDYNFPIFDFSIATNNRPLFFLSCHLIVESGLLARLQLPVDKFLNFMADIEAGYDHMLAFHNSIHAADVLHAIYHLSRTNRVTGVFSDLELLSIFVAAAVHDYNHPGVSNNFLIATDSHLARLYNDKSVLENHHCASAFEVLSRPKNAFLDHLDHRAFRSIRSTIIDMVLATDLAQHFALLTTFKKKVVTGGNFDPASSQEDRQSLMQMLMKCADVSNPTKSWPIYQEWITRITEEFFNQGDREKSLGLPVSPYCNRDGPNAASPTSSQQGFIEFIVHPLFEAFEGWTHLGVIRDGLNRSRERFCAPLIASHDGGGISSSNVVGGGSTGNSVSMGDANATQRPSLASANVSSLFSTVASSSAIGTAPSSLTNSILGSGSMLQVPSFTRQERRRSSEVSQSTVGVSVSTAQPDRVLSNKPPPPGSPAVHHPIASGPQRKPRRSSFASGFRSGLSLLTDRSGNGAMLSPHGAGRPASAAVPIIIGGRNTGAPHSAGHQASSWSFFTSQAHPPAMSQPIPTTLTFIESARPTVSPTPHDARAASSSATITESVSMIDIIDTTHP